MNLCSVATFLLRDLSVSDTQSLALVQKEIFCGPPTSYVSRKVINSVRRVLSNIPTLWDFVEKLTIEKPNLHTLKTSLLNVDINTLELRWTAYPFVSATTLPPPIDFPAWVPKLAVLIVKEQGVAKHCLPLFECLIIPKRLRLLDFKGVHCTKDNKELSNISKILSDCAEIKCEVHICECLLSQTIKLRRHQKLTVFPCSFLFVPEGPNTADDAN
jgi:hypothetical protein